MQATATPHNYGLKFQVLQGIASFTRKHQPRGIGRLLRTLYNSDLRYRDHFDIVAPYDSDLLINIDTASHIEWNLFFWGHYERDITELIKRTFRPGFVACDVGANIGCHTLTMAHSAGPTGTIFALEPHPVVFDRLVENIALNRMAQVKPLRCALSDTSGTAILHAFQEAASNRGASTFHPRAGHADRPQMSVEVRTLDELLQAADCLRLDCIKIDTEGHEYKVLLGSRDSLSTYRPYIILEYDQSNWQAAGYDFDAMATLLADLGYWVYTIHRGYLEKVEYGLPHKANILAVPQAADHSFCSLAPASGDKSSPAV